MKKTTRALIILALALHATGFAEGSAKKHSVYIWSGIKSMRGERVLMEVSVPQNANGTAVIICPGGSYHHLGVMTEGRTTARWFNSQGVTTCLLWYRVAKNNYHYPAPMQDAQRAIQLVRENRNLYKADKVGIIGFSAGGHLAAWSGMFGKRIDELKKIGIATSESLCPDFVISVYPVVSMQDDIGHRWSRKSLIGKKADQQKKDQFSLELQVPDGMPPTYLVACRDDPVVMFENSERLSLALEKAGADFVFKEYPEGGHGFGMMNNAFLKKYRWNEELKTWLKEKGFL